MSNQLKIRAVKIVGGQSALAKHLGVSQGCVWNWINRNNRISAEHVIGIERATNGQISRHDLRPDIYPIDDINLNQCESA